MKDSKFMKATAMLFTMILLIGSTFAENITWEHKGNNGGPLSRGKTNADWDNHETSVQAYIYMDVLDDAGNDAAYLSVTVNRFHYGRWEWKKGNVIDAVQYSGSACVYTGNWEGRAKVRVQVPRTLGGAPAIDQRERNIGGAGNPSSLSAYKSCKRSKDGINVNGNRNVTASARVTQGGINANIKLHVSEF